QQAVVMATDSVAFVSGVGVLFPWEDPPCRDSKSSLWREAAVGNGIAAGVSRVRD
ncbi:hypothetical protein TNCV_166821, partial [Trichonephila clavipes]